MSLHSWVMFDMEISYGIKWCNLHKCVEPVKLGRIWCTARIRLLHWNIVTSNDPIFTSFGYNRIDHIHMISRLDSFTIREKATKKNDLCDQFWRMLRICFVFEKPTEIEFEFCVHERHQYALIYQNSKYMHALAELIELYSVIDLTQCFHTSQIHRQVHTLSSTATGLAYF